jgi:hypothetical protein
MALVVNSYVLASAVNSTGGIATVLSRMLITLAQTLSTSIW